MVKSVNIILACLFFSSSLPASYAANEQSQAAIENSGQAAAGQPQLRPEIKKTSAPTQTPSSTPTSRSAAVPSGSAQSTTIALPVLPASSVLRHPPGGNGADNKILATAERAIDTEGAMFLDQNQVSVKAPVLTALIELRQEQSPYSIDASRERPITLKDVLVTQLSNNLDIKISQANLKSNLWTFRSTLGNFLPALSNQINLQGISGHYASPFGMISSVDTPYVTMPSALNWTAFNGGANLYGSLQALHNYRAAKYDYKRYANDFLAEGANLYYQLVLQDVILQIKIKALETSEALVEKASVQYQYGANTQLELYQAESQLARDQQALISQQIARRQAAVALATTLNINADEDLLVTDRVVSQMRLLDDKSRVADLVQIAIDNRPELKRWEQLRLAAKDAIKVAFAPLLPELIGSAGLSTTGAKVRKGTSLGGASSAGTGSFGAGSFSTSTVASTGITGNVRNFDLAEIFVIGATLQWNIGGMGLTDTAKVEAAKWQARKAQLEFARELTFVCRSVRDAYLDSLDAENLITATNAGVTASRQALRVAIIRLDEGVGTGIDVVTAQQNYTQALIAKANAIIQFNEAQVKLLRAMGIISVDNLLVNKPIFYKH